MAQRVVDLAYAPHASEALRVSKPLDGVHPQEAFHLDRGNVRYRAVLAGTRSGKTFAGAWEALDWCLTYAGTHLMATEPTYPMVRRILLPALAKLLGGPIGASPVVSRYNESEHVIEFVNGSVFWFGSLEDPSAMEGPTLDAWFGDEPRLVRRWLGEDGAWAVMTRRLSGTGRPGPVGAWLTTSAPSQALHEQFERRDSERYEANSRVYRWTPLDNPHLPGDYVEEITRSHKGSAYKRFILGQHARSEGLVFARFDPTSMVYPMEGPWDVVQGGIDWGWTNPAAVIVCKQKGDHYHFVEVEYGSQLRKDVLKRAVERATREHGVRKWWAGHDEPETITEWRRDGIPVETHTGKREESYRALVGEVDGGNVSVEPPAVNLLGEWDVLEWEGKDRDVPAPGPDHGTDGARYALPRRRVVRGFGVG